MSIFQEYAGPVGEQGYYSTEDWSKLQNPGWAKDQEEYDRFAQQAADRAQNRAEAMARAQEAIPYSYTQFGRGSTQPAFSLSGFSGHSSGGTSGLSGFAGTSGPTSTTTIEGSDTSAYGDVPVPDVHLEDGGAIVPKQNMGSLNRINMIRSPYADPINSNFTNSSQSAQTTAAPSLQSGIGGLFSQMQQQPIYYGRF